jgi:hypothetical protein
MVVHNNDELLENSDEIGTCKRQRIISNTINKESQNEKYRFFQLRTRS